MKISYNWLKQYLRLSPSGDAFPEINPEKTAELLTGCGLEVESIEKHETIKGGLEGCFIGEVKTKEKHPDADRLSITTVDIGRESLLNIVCGAPNVAAGQKVVVATVGTTLYPSKGEPITLKKAKIRGAASEGMICAEDELGLGASHDGIMVLEEEAKIGTPAKEYFHIESDYILEIGLTPNRPDAASHTGVAKDLFAVLNLSSEDIAYPFNPPSVEGFEPDSFDSNLTVSVEDPEACPRYSGLTLSGITVKESPDWLKQRLTAIGQKPINNIVDITNFVLHELGQPLHAFDADKIRGGKVIVKTLPEGTVFTTLDGTERKLSGNDLMICSGSEPMCIAGVFGGLHSGVTSATKNIFLESACFSPSSIRRTSKHHGLKTDASFRFERGTDPNITIYALQRAALLIKELAGGRITSDVIDVYPKPIIEKKIALSFFNLDRLIGKKLERTTVKKILNLLDIEVEHEGGETLLLNIPTNKVDVTQEADVIEEILRIYGCNNIEIPSSVHASLSYAPKPDPDRLRNMVADLLCGTGFMEIMSNSLTSASYMELLPSMNGTAVELLNPLSPELNILRPTLLFSGLEAVAYNRNRKSADLKMFEFGSIYFKTTSNKPSCALEDIREESRLSLLLAGMRGEENWNEKQSAVDFYFLKSIVENVLRKLGLSCSKTEETSNEQIGNGLILFSGKSELVRFGWVNKTVLRKFDIKQEVFFADFNWDTLMDLSGNSQVRYRELSKFPEVRRDLALVVDQQVHYLELEQLAFQTERKLLKRVGLFDVYEGDKIAAGKKSYALSFILGDEQATLTDKQVESAMERLIRVFREKVNAEIRS